MKGESGRVHCVRGIAVEVMRVLGADERGQERRTGAVGHVDELGLDSVKVMTV